jgi:hypothetical protein
MMNQEMEPANSRQNARKEVHANGTCQYRIRYASGAFQASGFTNGAHKKPRIAVEIAPTRPNVVKGTAADL